jgi:hypothetical protein
MYDSYFYAESLSELGKPFALEESAGWLLRRKIAGSSDYDAMGCYPVFCCKDWSGLNKDLNNINDRIISLSLVTDPFAGCSEAYLKSCFRDICYPFKQHFVIDLSKETKTFISESHFRKVKKAEKIIYVEKCDNPIDFIDEWITLYDNLIKRHSIRGILKFSREIFQKQLSIPGIILFRAVYQDKTVGMLLWCINNNTGYYHLGAYSSSGYELNASFALFWYIIDYFRKENLSYLGLGAGAGISNNTEDGLSRFKKGWSTGTKTSYFCGRIYNNKRYLELLNKEDHIETTKYFPAYRAGEFL